MVKLMQLTLINFCDALLNCSYPAKPRIIPQKRDERNIRNNMYAPLHLPNFNNSHFLNIDE